MTNKRVVDRATIEVCSAAGHEANRALSSRWNQIEHHWEESSRDHQEKIRAVTTNVLVHNHGPEQVHEHWLSMMGAAGWTYGTVKDSASKSHPAMKPYDELDLEQKVKNEMFVEVVLATYKAQRAVPM
jgi:hypothetical protein